MSMYAFMYDEMITIETPFESTHSECALIDNNDNSEEIFLN